MLSKRRKLRNFWINSVYQGRYVLSLIFSSVIALLCFGVVFYLFTVENYEVLIELSPLTSEAYDELKRELALIAVYLSIVGVVFILLVTAIGIVFSHRAAGPLYNIQAVSKRIQSGEPNARIRLRPSDDFQEVANHLNAAFDCMHFPDSPRYTIVEGTRTFAGVTLPLARLREHLQAGVLAPHTLVSAVGDSSSKVLELGDIVRS